MTSDLRTHRRNIPATTLETWIPILFGWFPLAFVVFIFVAIVFLFQGYQKKRTDHFRLHLTRRRLDGGYCRHLQDAVLKDAVLIVFR